MNKAKNISEMEDILRDLVGGLDIAKTEADRLLNTITAQLEALRLVLGELKAELNAITEELG